MADIIDSHGNHHAGAGAVDPGRFVRKGLREPARTLPRFDMDKVEAQAQAAAVLSIARLFPDARSFTLITDRYPKHGAERHDGPTIDGAALYDEQGHQIYTIIDESVEVASNNDLDQLADDIGDLLADLRLMNPDAGRVQIS